MASDDPSHHGLGVIRAAGRGRLGTIAASVALGVTLVLLSIAASMHASPKAQEGVPPVAGCCPMGNQGSNHTWSLEIVDDQSGIGRSTSLALDDSDRPHIAYYDFNVHTDLQYARWNGSAWNLTTVDADGDVGYSSSLALDSLERPHISYLDQTNLSLKYARWDGTAWNLTIVDAGGAAGGQTSLALDTVDRPHISYHGANVLKYARWDGAAWNLTTLDAGGDSSSLALDPSDRPRIAYYDSTNLDLKYALSDGTTWTNETVDAAGDVGSSTSLAIDTSDRPHISYLDTTNNALKYASWSGTVWNITAVDVAGLGQTSLALDTSDRPHISYQPALSLKYAQWNGSAWNLEMVDTSGDVGYSSSLALDAADRPHISYFDHMIWGLKYAIGTFNSIPNASFNVTPSNGTILTSFAVDASSSTDVEDSPPLLAARWDWEDDGLWDTTFATTKTAQHLYAAPGAQTIRLEVQDTGGLTNQTTRAVTVTNTAPIASAGLDQVTSLNVLVLLNGSGSYDPDLEPLTYLWRQTAGPPLPPLGNATSAVADCTPSSVGVYSFELTVSDPQGANASDGVNVTVTAPPDNPPAAVALVSPLTGFIGTQIAFDASGSTDDHGILSYMWDFGDGGTDPSALATHAYATHGPFAVSLTVWDTGGQTGIDTVTVRIENQPPIASITANATATVVNASIAFNGSGSNDPDGTIVNYAFDFGDGTPLVTELSPVRTHAFSAAGSYTISLVVTDSNGSASAPATVQVFILAPNSPPTAAIQITPTTGDLGTVFTFDGSASTDDGTIVAYAWEFGDGTTGTGVTVTHQFERTGPFAVALTVTDDGGLVGSGTESIAVSAALETTPRNGVLDWPIVGILVLTLGLVLGALWRLRVLWLTPFLVWCYSKLRRDEVLDNFARGEIYGFIRLNPGESYSDIRRSLGVAAGLLTYHLAVLEREGLIRSVAHRARRLYYLRDAPLPENGGDLRALQIRMLGILTEEPGIAINELATLLGINRHVALYHIRKLVRSDLVRLERQMTRLRVYPVRAAAISDS